MPKAWATIIIIIIIISLETKAKWMIQISSI